MPLKSVRSSLTIGAKVNDLLEKIKEMDYGVYSLDTFKECERRFNIEQILEILLIITGLYSWQYAFNKGVNVASTKEKTLISIYDIEKKGEISATVVYR